MYLLFVFIFVSTASYSQKDSTAYERFFTGVLASYKTFAKPPMKNFLESFSNIGRHNFSVYNPLFRIALKEISAEKNIEESAAVEELFQKSFKDLLPHLWINAQEIYTEYYSLFFEYNTKMCPCITKQVKKEDNMNVVLKATNNCIAVIATDTAYLRKSKAYAANKTANELNTLQQYATLYAYQQCSILNIKFSEVILNEPVLSTYFAELESMQMYKGIRVIEHYRDKKFDSLKAIFPAYKNFLPALDKAVKILKQPGITMRPAHVSQTGAAPITEVKFLKNANNGSMITFLAKMKLSTDAFDSNITSFSFEKYQYKLSDDDEKIEMIEDVQIGSPKNN
jgi:hypothetical protein